MKKLFTLSALAFYLNINAQTINTIAGNGNASYSGDGGQATAASLNTPTRLSLDNTGNLFITDRGNVCIRKLVLSTGVITTVAGNGATGFSGDGGQATAASFNSPAQAVVDANGNLYISDTQNNRIRKVTASTGIVSTIVGTGAAAYGGDGGQATAAQIYNPYDMALDVQGNLYFADRANNRVRKVDANTGIISTIAGTGTGSFSGDGGQATAAQVNNPIGLTVDPSGNIYIGDYGNKRVRKVDVGTGIITTIAGTGVVGFSGDGGQATAAQISNATTVATDMAGNVYIADVNNNRIREVVVSTGIINTIAGNGVTGFSGDGGLATAAELNIPGNAILDATGNIYIADYGNNRVRKITNLTTGIKNISTITNVSIYPNPTQNNFVIESSTTDKQTLQLFDINGKQVLSQTIGSKTSIDVSNLSPGVYNLSIINSEGIINKKLIIVK